jgi:hypothetical protein
VEEKMKKTIASALLAASALVASAGFMPANAVTLGFNAITSNNAAQVTIAEAQMFLDVTDAGSGNVLFLFSNIGPIASALGQIYFNDDTPLYSTTSFVITNGTGVSFVRDITPDSLPGGTGFGFGPGDTLEFEADANNPVPTNGVNPGETLGITLSLLAGFDFDDVLTKLSNGLLAVGIHVQSIGLAANGLGGSESLINDPYNNDTNPVVPLPAAFPLLLGGLGGLAWLGRFRKRSGSAAA